MTIEAGGPAPDFTLPTDGGGSLSLSELKGRNVILYFYPKDDTPGCTAEACAFQAALPDFTGANATIVGISKDEPGRHDKFKAKYGLAFSLASDADGKVCEDYGARVQYSVFECPLDEMRLAQAKAALQPAAWPTGRAVAASAAWVPRQAASPTC